MVALKSGLESQQNVFRKQSNDSFSPLRASYYIARLLAKKRKTFSDGEFVRKCLQHIVQETCLEKETVFNIVSLSCATMMQQVEDINSVLTL
jgi:hypothetical protein